MIWSMRNICIFTSTRAEWGLLRGVAELVDKSDRLSLRLLVSGTHLSDDYGRTVQEIEQDGFAVEECIDILKFDDTRQGICNSMSLAMSGYGEALGRMRPDILIVLGDRFETFCAAAAAQVQRVPVAHIHGGEITEGALDEAFRHSITKMSHLHFPCCDAYRRRIIQLGENPSMIFNVGSLGAENIRSMPLLNKSELEIALNFELDKPFLLVTYHPETLMHSSAAEQADILTGALDAFPMCKIIFTAANSDTDGVVINRRLSQYTARNPGRCLMAHSLGALRYLSAMSLCAAVVGNSSSGILEAPAFRKPTVNIGDRQKGRLRAHSVIDCAACGEDIIKALEKALSPSFVMAMAGMSNPFEKEGTAAAIVKVLASVEQRDLSRKHFFDIC